jgi:putative peptidoglycan lipid II flippase
MLYVLPVGLFGMSVAAAELPELSRTNAADMTSFMTRVTASVRQVMFLTIPTCVGYLVFGLPLICALFERGRFGRHDSWLIYVTLGGYTLGLLATTASRLFQNAFYALQDTRTPARIALVRVLTSTVASVPLMLYGDRLPVATLAGSVGQGQPLFFGAAGLALAATAGAWVELTMLYRLLSRRFQMHLPWRSTAFLLAVALLAALPALGLWWLLLSWPAVLLAISVLATFGGGYLVLTWLCHSSELHLWAGRLFPPRRR